MTAKFKFLAVLLVLLASWAGQVRAEQAPPPRFEQSAFTAASDSLEAPDRLAWQRVGDPIREG